MAKRMSLMIVALIIVFGGLLGFNLFKAHMIKKFFANYKTPAISVSTVKAKAKLWVPTFSSVGTITATNGVDINSQASGTVTAIHFKSGQIVQKSTPLINIDDSVEQATLRDNQANFALQKLDFKRQDDLFKKGATSSANVDKARSNMDQAMALVDKVKAQIAQKHIQSPFAGKLGIRQVNLGQYISTGNTTIVTLQSLDPLYINFYLPGKFINQLHQHQRILFKIDAYPQRIFTGKINAINSKVDSSTHNIQLQAVVANCPRKALTKADSPLIQRKKIADLTEEVTLCDSAKNAKAAVKDYAFLPGLFANVTVLRKAKHQAVILPKSTITYTLYGNAVYLLKQDAKNKDAHIVVQQFVHTGDERDNQVVITKGVKAGDEVVSSGQLKLQNDARVTVNNSVKLHSSPSFKTMGQ